MGKMADAADFVNNADSYEIDPKPPVTTSLAPMSRNNRDDSDDDKSIDFESLKSSDYVNFHHSFDVATGAVSAKAGLHNSCPTIRPPDISKRKQSKNNRSKRKKHQRSKSIEMKSHTRSFSASPPLSSELFAPKPVSPRRAQSLYSSFSAFTNTLNSGPSATQTFQSLNSSFSAFPSATGDSRSHQHGFRRIRSMQGSYTVMPTESGTYAAALLSPELKSRRLVANTLSPRPGAIHIARRAPNRSKTTGDGNFFSFSESFRKLSIEQSEDQTTTAIDDDDESAVVVREENRKEGDHFSVVRPTGSEKEREISVTTEPNDDLSREITTLPPSVKEPAEIDLLARSILTSPIKYNISRRRASRRSKTDNHFGASAKDFDSVLQKDRKRLFVKSKSASSIKPSNLVSTRDQHLQRSPGAGIVSRKLGSPRIRDRRRVSSSTTNRRSRFHSSLGSLNLEDLQQGKEHNKSPAMRQRRLKLHGSDRRLNLNDSDTLTSPSTRIAGRRSQRHHASDTRLSFLHDSAGQSKSPSGRNDGGSRLRRPRRNLSLDAVLNNRNSLKSSSPGRSSRNHSAEFNMSGSHLLLDDNLSLCPSESVPLASLATVSQRKEKKSISSKKTFLETLDLVGKWKRKTRKEDRLSMEALGNGGKEDRLKHGSRTKSRRSDSRKKADSEKSGKTKRRSRSQSLKRRDSLVDALETHENRLSGYLTKTPPSERKKLDKYWVEAFKRNFERRSLSLERPSPRHKAT